jgi:adenylate kinase family enzyme
MRAIILYGPSGCGKTALAKSLSKKYGFKHCDRDNFLLMFSKERSAERSSIADEVALSYIKQLAARKYSMIIEALSDSKIASLKKDLIRKGYSIKEVSLISSLKKCLKNNLTRKERKFSEAVIRHSFAKHTKRIGSVIDVSEMAEPEVLRAVEKIIS